MKKRKTRSSSLVIFVSSLIAFLVAGNACAEGRAAGNVFSDDGFSPEMVVLPASEFVQGSDKFESGHLYEKPQHNVKLARSFAVARDDGSVRKHEGKCDKRVVRGGAWLDGASTARSAYRYSEVEEMRNHQTGFRVARDL